MISSIPILATLLLLISSCLCSISEYGELTNPEGLAIMTIHKPESCSAQAQINDVVSYHYIGRLLSDSKIFGRSFDYDTPYITPLGQARIIAGMDQGLVGTCLGERRRITIPPHLGYGKKGVAGTIPPDSTLVFYIKLLDIERNGISLRYDQNFESLYKSASRNYEAEKWQNALNAFEQASHLFSEFENKTVECVRQCSDSSKDNSYYDDTIEIGDSLLTYPMPGIGPVKTILPMLRTSKCFNSCRANSFKREDFEVSYNIIDAFFSKSFYLMVQWAYNQIGDQENAALYNQIYYNLFPEEEIAKKNKLYYERTLGTEKYKSIRNRAFIYSAHYYYNLGSEAYKNSQWTSCIENINLALQHYKQDWMRCREFCSAFPVSKGVSVVSGWTGIHLAQLEGLVLQCKEECLLKMEMVEGVKIPNLLGNLFGYIQSCYYQNKQVEEGYKAAITWRAFDFSDETAESAVDYYIKNTDIIAMKYKPIEEYIRLKEMSEIEARLLVFYNTNSFQKKQGRRGEYTRDNQDLNKQSMGRIRDEF